MSQFALGLATGAGLWTIGMGATAVSGGFSDTSSRVLDSEFATFKLSSVNEISQNYKSLKCISELFGEIEWNKTGNESNALTNNNVEGCLAVWWEKETYDSGKWKGSWNLLWGMKDGARGMIFSINIKAGDGKTVLNTALYYLEGVDKKWVVKMTNIHNNDQEITSSNKQQWWVNPDKQKIDVSNGWEFEIETDKICSSSNQCISDFPKRESTNLNWKFVAGAKEGERIGVHTWIKDIEKLFLGNSLKVRLQQVIGYFELLTDQK